IHCSARAQLLRLAAFLYGSYEGPDDLVVLVIAPERLGVPVRYEVRSRAARSHIYGPIPRARAAASWVSSASSRGWTFTARPISRSGTACVHSLRHTSRPPPADPQIPPAPKPSGDARATQKLTNLPLNTGFGHATAVPVGRLGPARRAEPSRRISSRTAGSAGRPARTSSRSSSRGPAGGRCPHRRGRRRRSRSAYGRSSRWRGPRPRVGRWRCCPAPTSRNRSTPCPGASGTRPRRPGGRRPPRGPRPCPGVRRRCRRPCRSSRRAGRARWSGRR
ncbi:DUF952 domain-containing protein, partial [Streptomyces sp. NPDC001792]|uniref:DUF952 domain-containing protein n=1 Tax=Streptomyces sp. NPDC001792 TaxID=3154524 RepID=UPI003317CE28